MARRGFRSQIVPGFTSEVGSTLSPTARSLRIRRCAGMERRRRRLLSGSGLGPWSHMDYYFTGEYDGFSFGPAAFLDKNEMSALHLAYFDAHLRGSDTGFSAAPVRIFVMGENVWRDENEWPLARTQYVPWHLRAGGELSAIAPDTDEEPSTYTYDPADPTPFAGKPSLPEPHDLGVLDGRVDIMRFQSAVLDRPTEVTGPLKVVLYVSTDVVDTDFVARLSDVHPDGSAWYVAEGDRIAAVIIEPVPANHGLLLQRREFLVELRNLTRQHGALLIFDEVISGFRLARGGAAQLLNIVPDLATFGKVIGGGMPVGAFGGRSEIMARLAPLGDAYQAGTLSGNPVAMASGIATLDVLNAQSGWDRLESLGAELEQLLRPVVAEAKFPVQLVRIGSLFWLAFHGGDAPRNAVTLSPEATARFSALFHAMLERGVYLPPSAYEACFLSLAHRSADLQRLAQALRESLATLP